jgi:hypothetical protein
MADRDDLQFRLDRKREHGCIGLLKTKQHFGKVEEYFGARHKDSEGDTRGCVHYSVYCEDLAMNSEYSAPLQAVRMMQDVLLESFQAITTRRFQPLRRF